jgi:hypothetical protein
MISLCLNRCFHNFALRLRSISTGKFSWEPFLEENLDAISQRCPNLVPNESLAWGRKQDFEGFKRGPRKTYPLPHVGLLVQHRNIPGHPWKHKLDWGTIRDTITGISVCKSSWNGESQQINTRSDTPRSSPVRLQNPACAQNPNPPASTMILGQRFRSRAVRVNAGGNDPRIVVMFSASGINLTTLIKRYWVLK